MDAKLTSIKLTADEKNFLKAMADDNSIIGGIRKGMENKGFSKNERKNKIALKALMKEKMENL